MKLTVLKNNVPLNEVLVETSDVSEMYEIYVGRAEDCHVRIDDPLVSRHHFVLKNEGSRWYCEKLTHLGAITVNGQTVTKNEVKNGDEIKCGHFSIFLNGIVSSHQVIDQKSGSNPLALEEENLSDVLLDPNLISVEAPVATEQLAPDLMIDAPIEMDDGISGDEFVPDSNDSNSTDNEYSDDSMETIDFDGENESKAESQEDEFSAALNTENDFNESSESNSDEFGVATTNDEQETTRVIQAFVNYQLVLFGEHAPYDRYQIDRDEIFIGRDANKCQIVLDDPEVSSVHAVLRKNGNEIILADLNSSNGTILNAERINKAQLSTGDEFVIGGTSFTLEIKSDLLESESDRLMPVESGQVIETEEIEEEEVELDENGNLDFAEAAPVEKSIIKRVWKDPKKRKFVIYGAVAAAMYLLIFYEPETEQTVSTQKTDKVVQTAKDEKPKLKLTEELENRRNVAYELGVSYFEQNEYNKALEQLQIVTQIDPEYKNVQSYLEQTNIALKRLKELDDQRRADEDRIKTKKLVEELLVKAREAVKERQVKLAESYFSQITEKDPENIEVQQLKLELETWQKDEEKKALDRAAKEELRRKMVDKLSPGKTYYLKKEWYRATLKLEEFLRAKGMDEDLVKEASDMLSDAKNQLSSELGPLLGKARSLKEGQDLKGAYQAYLDILKMEPTNSEALNEVDDIKNHLETRSKKIYREAIIAESLSLFSDAKEKFQEVQQISPTDSEYYKKASEKLRNYLE